MTALSLDYLCQFTNATSPSKNIMEGLQINYDRHHSVVDLKFFCKNTTTLYLVMYFMQHWTWL